jgi:hypothetical protein
MMWGKNEHTEWSMRNEGEGTAWNKAGIGRLRRITRGTEKRGCPRCPRKRTLNTYCYVDRT